MTEIIDDLQLTDYIVKVASTGRGVSRMGVEGTKVGAKLSLLINSKRVLLSEVYILDQTRSFQKRKGENIQTTPRSATNSALTAYQL